MFHFFLSSKQTKRTTKNDLSRRTRSQKRDASHTNSSLFFCSSIFSSWFFVKLIIIQRAVRKTHPRTYQCIWKNYVKFSQKYYNSTTLSIWIVYRDHVRLKLLLCWKMRFSTSFVDIILYAEAAIHTKKLFFHFIVCYF